MIRFPQLSFIGIIIFGILLLAAGWYGHAFFHSHSSTCKPRRVATAGYHFTSPLLDVELPEGMSVTQEPIPFKRKVVAFTQAQIRSGRVHSVAVYYRDLLDGPWFGINEHHAFNAASMMKVPVMIAWLRRAEKDPRELRKKLRWDGKEDLCELQAIRPARTLSPGRSYSVEELLTSMLRYSDNNATKLLYEALADQELGAVLDGMAVDNSVRNGANMITVHAYSGFFRVLYNASFLSRQMSEKGLELLSLEDFPQGILAGLPPGTPAATKFGEVTDDPRGERQLHEFGIVYHRKQPYIIGIMTSGNDYTIQAEVIRDISRLIYSEIDRQSLNAPAR